VAILGENAEKGSEEEAAKVEAHEDQGSVNVALAPS